MFILLLIIIIGWIVLNNIEHEKKKKHELEREKYWASPEGIKERQQQIERGKKASKWLANIEAVRRFKSSRHQWCWSCKNPINITIKTDKPIYFDSEEQEEQFNKELDRIVCSRCHWIICGKCKSCECGRK